MLQFIEAQDLWQPHYQILSIIFPKEFIDLNVKIVESNTSIATVFLNTKNFKMI